MKSRFLQRLKVRKYHMQAFARLGCSAVDRLKLAWLGWRRIAVSGAVRAADARLWSARLNFLDGKRVHLCPDDICHVGIFEEVILHRAYDLDLPGFEPDFILDVGAHLGLFSLCAAARWPGASILAFEPHPDNAVWARRNFAGNGIRGSVVEAAASTRPGWMNFDLGGGMGRLAAAGNTRVVAADLPAIIRAFPASRLLLKMDIEGGEMDVLPEVLPLLPPTNAVFVELHGPLPECERMMGKIKSLGFQTKILGHKRSDDGAMSYMDLFLRPDATTRP